MVHKSTTNTVGLVNVFENTFEITSPSTQTWTSSNPSKCPEKTYVGFHEPPVTSEAVTLLVGSFTRLKFRCPNYSLYDGGSNRLKFPYLGVYLITLFISFDEGGSSNSMRIRLKNDVSPNQEGFLASITTGGGSIDKNPTMLLFTWRCVNLNERVEIIGEATTATVTGVTIFSGAIHNIERNA